jgi:hypothetical protein
LQKGNNVDPIINALGTAKIRIGRADKSPLTPVTAEVVNGILGGLGAELNRCDEDGSISIKTDGTADGMLYVYSREVETDIQRRLGERGFILLELDLPE